MMELDLVEQHIDYVLVEDNCTDELLTPLKRSGRLKYNCISVTNKLVAIGSNTGGIYIFSRNEQKLLQIAFAEKETGSVSIVKISPHEKFVAFISSNNVHVLDLRLDSRSKAETLKSSNALIDSSVTCLHWDNTSTKLYVGDDLGNVSVMSVSSSKAKNLFSLPLEVIMKLDSLIVQIDNIEDKLLVSTLTKCYLCHTSKQQYSQIGQRLRDGYYGACFLQQPMSAPMIYCARPGSRIWEVDFEGTVLNTHQFKQLLAIPTRQVIKLEDNNNVWVVSSQNGPAQSVAFPKLVVLRNRYLLTWTNEKLYVVDPINVRVILWTSQFADIQDVCCVDCKIYIFFKSMKIECVTFLPAISLIPQYIKVNNLESAANVLLSYKHIFAHKQVRNMVGLSEIDKLHEKLVANEMVDLAGKIKEVIDDIEEKMAIEDTLETSDTHNSGNSAIMDEQGNIESVNTSGYKEIDKDQLNDNVDTRLEGCDKYDLNNEVNSQIKCEVKSFVYSEVNVDDIKHGASDHLVKKDFENEVKTRDNIENKIAIEMNSTEETAVDKSNDSANKLVPSYMNDVNTYYDGVQVTEYLENNNVRLKNSEQIPLEISSNFDQTHNDLVNDKSVEHMMTDSNEQNCRKLTGSQVQNSQELTDSKVHNSLDITGSQEQNNQELTGSQEQNNRELTGSQVQNSQELTGSLVQYDQELAGSPIPRLVVPGTRPQSVSPVTIETNDNLVIEDEDDIGYLPTKGSIVRRLSSTSLSSLSSAEVFIDTSHSYENESSDPIAMPVRRKSGKKKIRRKSAVDMISSGNVPIKRSSSTGSRKSKSSSKDGTMSPPGSIRSYKEEDSISVYSNDSITMEDGGMVAMVTQECKDEDNIDGLSYNTKNSEAITGSPVSYTEEYSQSGEFSKSGDFLKSGEFSPGEATLTRSLEITKQGSSSSAPKTALLQFKNKMQNKVSTKTKVIIKNIKEKNLLTKAKEIAGNLSQGSEAYFNSGEAPFTDNISVSVQPQTDSETSAKTSSSQSIDTSDFTPKVTISLSDLDICTHNTVARLQDVDLLCDIDEVKAILDSWITVLNSTMKSFLIERYSESRNVSERADPNVKIQFRDLSLNNNESVRISTKRDEGLVEPEFDNNVDTVIKKESKSDVLDKIGNILNGPSFCFIKDPLYIPQDWLCHVCNLAQACFDIGCHGNLFNNLKSVQNETKSCDNSTLSSVAVDNKDTSGNTDCSKVKGGEVTEVGKDVKDEANDNVVSDKDPVSKTEDSCDIVDTLVENNDKSQTNNVLHNSQNVLSIDLSSRQNDSVIVVDDDLMAKEDCNADVREQPNGLSNDSAESSKSNTIIDKQAKNSKESCDKQTNLDHEYVPDFNTPTVDAKMESDKHNDETFDSNTEGVKTKDILVDGAKDEENMDYNVGLFVRCYFPYLNVSRIREQSKSSQSSFYLWSALTTCMEAKSYYDAEKFGVEEKSMISYLIENQAEYDDGATVLGHISKLFRNNPNSIVDVCVRCHPYIQPIDVIYLCKYHKVAMETVYKQYMNCMVDMRSTESRKQVLNELSLQDEAALQWLDMLLSEDDYTLKVRNNDGCPRCMSHRLRWKNAKIINDYLDIIKRKDIRTQYLQLCRKHGYWLGVLNILKTSECRQEHLKYVLLLGDIMLLSDHSALGYLPSCTLEWEEMLTMFVQLSCTVRYQSAEIPSSDWSDLITWDNIGILLVKYIGPEAAVSLLGKYNENALSIQFYQTCLLTGMVQKQQRMILHSMLEKVDTYLWSQRPTALNPQLQYLAATEKKISTQDSHDQSDVLPNMLNHIQKHKTEVYVEDPDCHWGIQNTIKMSCKCCNLPLKDIVSHEEPGVLVFKCGHSFHKFCLPGKECPFCR